MAITITQQPTYPNATYTDLVYVVQSTETAQPQFQYVMDIVSGSTILSRVRQYPNPSAVGVFNPARILNDYLEYPTQFDLTVLTTSNTQVGQFTINFGEEYGTSISSSVTLYDGAGSPGSGSPMLRCRGSSRTGGRPGTPRRPIPCSRSICPRRRTGSNEGRTARIPACSS